MNKPETGNDAPSETTNHEDTHTCQESAGKQGDESNEPDYGKGNVENDVVDADDEVFHGLIPCHVLIKQLSLGWAKDITLPSFVELAGENW